MSTSADHIADQRIALITGGGSGIGRSTALMLAKKGWSVVIIGRREEALREVAALNPSISYEIADIADPTQGRRVVERAAADGRLDALVNNAGVLTVKPTTEIDPGELTSVFTTNVLAPVLLVKFALPMLSAAGGSIVNISSAVAARPTKTGLFYGASRAALDYLTRSWALELADLGIRVNGVAPGPTETGILERTLPEWKELAAMKTAETEAIPLKRRGQPDEIAYWIHELVRPSATWVTGQVIAVDGGVSVA